eukprot:TRINITY_DN3101_c0_g1_i2.p1 TRINITY_DN3101_c0_g1~~TRINITY_DN3101_c0_g1_i2.p1  ORF type:complete len:576 (-),score=200.56 TRINITY_DN3101_c0_g1_i2:392-2119(-)
MDLHGNLCGRDNTDGSSSWVDPQFRMNFKDSKYLYWINPTNLTLNKCVPLCPQTTEFTAECDLSGTALTLAKLQPSWVDPWNNPKCQCTYNNSATTAVLANNGEPECFFQYQSSPIARRCVPGNASLLTQELSDQVAKYNDFFTRTYSDLQRGYQWIIASGFIAMVLGFIWLLLLRLLAGIMVWFTIIATWLLCAAFSAWLYLEGKDRVDRAAVMDPKDEDFERNAKAIQITSYVVIGITFILLVVILFMYKRIQIAIGIIKHAGRALNKMPTIVLIPVVSFVIVGIVALYFFAIAAYLYSAGEITVDGCCRDFTFDNDLKQAIVLHFFGCIWTALFILAIGQTTIAGAVAQYYFTRDKDDLPLSPVLNSFGRVVRYHLGSLAFGSMLIAIVVTIRLIMAYIKKQVKKENTLLKYIMCIIECCLWCFQKFLEFIATHAYIQIAIFGESFCKSAKEGFQLMVRNPARAVAVSVVATFVMFLGKVFIVVLTVLIAAELFKTETPAIESFLLLFFVFLLAYIIAVLFMSVYEMAIKTTLQCFLEDEERNYNNPFAPKSLRSYMQKHTKKAIGDGGKKA